MRRHERPFRLKEFKVEVTYRCDLNCIHCSSDARPSNSLEMAREDCLRIVVESAKMGAEEVAFSGGEPLLWPHIFEVAESATKHRLRVTIYTSGNTENFKEKAARLCDCGVSRLVFSIFGGTALSHERVTRKARSFERTLEAMDAAATMGCTTELHFVPMSSNYRELSEVARLGCQHSASRVSLLRLVPQGRAALIPGRILSRIQNIDLRREVMKLREEFGAEYIRTGSPYNFLMVNDHPGCWAAIDRLIIEPDLQIVPCDAFKRIGSKELVGTEDWSSLSRSSLLGCWDNSPYLEAVREYLTSDFGAPCNECRTLEQCLSGCLAQKAIAYASLEKCPDPDCLGPDFRGDMA